MSAPDTLHASLVARRIEGFWRGVLLRGHSGAGKSSLALRTLSLDFHLVADDRVIVWRSGREVFGRAPEVLAGLIEVRGMGVISSPACIVFAEIALVVDLVNSETPIERFPDPERVEIAGLAVPLIRIAAGNPAAPEVLAAAFAALRRPL